MLKKSTFIYLILCLSAIFLSFSIFSGCLPKNTLAQHVSELRSDLFFGQSQNYSLKAGYGFKETPYHNDGNVKQKEYLLTFRLEDKETDQLLYSLSMTINSNVYSAEFKINPITHALTAEIKIDNFNLKTFDVEIAVGADKETITMTSILPENTISYEKALQHLQEKQSKLLSSYYDQNGLFNAEIHIRVLVKDQKPYWYVGLAKNKNLKALLIDGVSGEILAIREVL